ncbi:hypothetical protein [Chitinimonas sp. BJB300]|uniref:hypothetical protein n=1 Tax=Chitinimonas sp. BJB300 TaxID=1559339 RepID=UPI0011121B2D|nr:hypothetical protein [Chitinimonas sp. BJB300]TSJ88190.1 hypothetical protein FG002_011810 [Chitinimonas sp. BJB300]
MRLSKQQAELAKLHEPGFVTKAIPEELASMVDAWIELYESQRLSPRLIDSLSGIAECLKHGINPTKCD